MWFFYVMSLVPLTVGAVLWYYDKEVVWWEWLISFAVALAMAVCFQFIAVSGMTSDVETWSGKVSTVTHHPYWKSHYTTEETITNSKGEVVGHRTVHHYDGHPEHWTAETTILGSSGGLFGRDSYEPSGIVIYDISEGEFDQMAKQFGSQITVETPSKADFYSGDRNIYKVYNITHVIIPATAKKRWSNKVKAAPTIFSFIKVPTNVTVYRYPQNSNWRQSDRLLGTAIVLFDRLKFDQLNAYLGPMKKVNLIIVGFGAKGESLADYQQAAWIGGKKNDLVICFGGGSRTTPAAWCKAFGWTDKELVKQDLQSLFLEHPVNDELLPLISDEVVKNYVIKDWSKFDYIKIEPPTWSYVLFIIVMLVSQTGLWVYFHKNEYER